MTCLADASAPLLLFLHLMQQRMHKITVPTGTHTATAISFPFGLASQYLLAALQSYQLRSKHKVAHVSERACWACLLSIRVRARLEWNTRNNHK